MGASRRGQTTGDDGGLYVTVEGIAEGGSICKGFNLLTLQAVATTGTLHMHSMPRINEHGLVKPLNSGHTGGRRPACSLLSTTKRLPYEQ